MTDFLFLGVELSVAEADPGLLSVPAHCPT